MVCEGLVALNEQRAWRNYSRQRADKANKIRAYSTGMNGPSYPIALKGRAWFDTAALVDGLDSRASPIPAQAPGLLFFDVERAGRMLPDVHILSVHDRFVDSSEQMELGGWPGIDYMVSFGSGKPVGKTSCEYLHKK